MRIVVVALLLCGIGCEKTKPVATGPVASSEEQDVAPFVEPVQVPDPVKVADTEWAKLAAEFDVESDAFTQVVGWYPKGGTFLLGKQEYCIARISVNDGSPNVWIDCGYKHPLKFLVLQTMSFKIGKTVWDVQGKVFTDLTHEHGPRESMVFGGKEAEEIVAALRENPNVETLLRMSGGKATRDRVLTKKEIDVLSRTGSLFKLMQTRAAAAQSLDR